MRLVLSLLVFIVPQLSMAFTPNEYCKTLPAISCEVLNTDVYVVPGTAGTPSTAPVLLPSGTNITGTPCSGASCLYGGGGGSVGSPTQVITVIKQCKDRVFEVKTITSGVPSGTSGNLAGACI